MSHRTTALDHPPRPRLVFRVGVVGNRFAPRMLTPSAGLRAMVTVALQMVLGIVKNQRLTISGAYADGAPSLRIVASLAEGAEQLVTDLALKQGYELQCPFPFTESVYRNEIAKDHPEAAETFDRLLREAGAAGRTVIKLELDGDPAAHRAAYRDCGRMVAAQSDLLLALWDGRRDDPGCGIMSAIRRALQDRVPVLWIDLAKPHRCRFLTDEDMDPETPPTTHLEAWFSVPYIRGQLREVVETILAPPIPIKTHWITGAMETRLADYFAEPRRRWNLARPWRLFHDLVAVETPELLSGLRLLGAKTSAPEDKQSPDWLSADEWPSGPPEGRPPAELNYVTDRLHPHYGWAVHLADWYGDNHRGAVVAIPALATASVAIILLCLLLPGWRSLGFQAAKLAVAAVEVGLVGSIVGLIHCGKVGQWRARREDYQFLAERLHELRWLVGSGGARPLMRSPASAGRFAGHNDPDSTWMAWLVRALERELGLLPVTIDDAYLRQFIGHMRVGLVAEQEREHREARHRLTRIDRRLHRLARGLFRLTLAVFLGHLILLLLEVHLPTVAVSSALGGGAICLLLGTALTVLRDQGELQRGAARSEARYFRMLDVGLELSTLRSQLEFPWSASRTAVASIRELTEVLVRRSFGAGQETTKQVHIRR